MKMKIITIIIKRLGSKNPKLFAILRNVCIILVASLGAFQLTEWGGMLSDQAYTMLYSIFAAVAATSQVTTTKKSLLAKDKNHLKEN